MKTFEMKIFKSVLVLCLSGMFWACGSSGEADAADTGAQTVGSETAAVENNGEGMHTIVALEVLPTDKYVYVYGEENGEKYWIAGLKSEVSVGESYHFSDGFLQTDFHSKEYDRVFDEVYLVSEIIPVNQTDSESKSGEESAESEITPTQIVVIEGSIRISELVENAENLEGQQVQVSGVVTKINLGIMNRNWIHIKDGSKDGFDLVVTTDEEAEVGEIVTMKAVVTLNKDFGAGYKYEVILENGTVVK